MKTILTFLVVICFITNYDSSLAQWTQTSGPLGVEITDFAMSGSDLFVATSGGIYHTSNYVGGNGVWFSSNNGVSWSSMNEGFVGGALVTSLFVLNNYLFAGTSGQSVWKRDLDSPLPVELISFEAAVDRRDVTLFWTTASEINNSGFEIERRIVNEGITRVWEKIGFVRGSGTTFTPTNYSFKDAELSTGKYNYRLKQIDLNGIYEYYDLRNEVVIGIKVEYKLSQNYPNPFNPTTKIDYELHDDGMVNIKLYDLSGKELRTILNEARTAGYYTLEFNAEDLSSGVYIYRMEVDGILKDTKQMILLK